MSRKVIHPRAAVPSLPKLSPGERLLYSLTEDLDLDKSIKKLNISREEARVLLRGFLKDKMPAASGDAAGEVTKKAAPAKPLSPSKAGGGVYELYVDGGSRGNPGPSGAGAVIKGLDGAVVKRLKKKLGIGTNNRAEYMALIMGVEAAIGLGAKRVNIFADSELMVRQISGRYRVKSPLLLPLYSTASGLLSSLKGFTITHIPRALNSEADSLANEAMDA